MNMRTLSKILLLAGFMAIISTTCFSQQMGVFGPSGMPLTKQDLVAMAAASGPLLNDDTVPLDTIRSWSNEKSGNHGTIKLVKRFEYNYEGAQLPCRKLLYRTEFRMNSQPYSIVLNRCKTADGTWKIL
jgi:surface antigen